MYTKQFHPIRRMLQRVAIKTIKLIDPEKGNKRDGLYERETTSICKRLISLPDSILLISPISGKRYIKSEDNQLFVIIENFEVTIVNHSYSYDIKMGTKAFSHITNIFDNEVEKRRLEMENEIRSNVKHSLSNIFKGITNEQVQ